MQAITSTSTAKSTIPINLLHRFKRAIHSGCKMEVLPVKWPCYQKSMKPNNYEVTTYYLF